MTDLDSFLAMLSDAGIKYERKDHGSPVREIVITPISRPDMYTTFNFAPDGKLRFIR